MWVLGGLLVEGIKSIVSFFLSIFEKLASFFT